MSECFRIDSVVRQMSIMSTWFFNAYMDAVMKELKVVMGRSEISRGGMRVEIAGLLYADDLVLCGE